MFNAVFTSTQSSLAKLLSSAIIILGLFTFAPIVNTNPAVLVGSRTEQLITKGDEKVSYFYQTPVKPFHESTNTIYKTILMSYNAKVAVQSLRDKIYFFSLDQRGPLKHFTPSLSDREDYFFNRA